MKTKNLKALVRETFKEWSDDNASRLAAALAYYTVISLPALVILIIALAGTVLGEEAARGQVIQQLQSLLGQKGAESVHEIIASASNTETKTMWASILSSVILVLSAMGVLLHLQDSLNAIWKVKSKPGSFIRSIILKRILSFGLILSIGFLLLVSLAVSASLAMFSDFLGTLAPGLKIIWPFVDFLVSLVFISALFSLMFKYLPDAEISWKDVFAGSILTSLLFSIGKLLIGLYLGKSEIGSTYGVPGSLVIVLVWIYYSAQIFFLGAEFTQVYSRHYGSRINLKKFL